MYITKVLIGIVVRTQENTKKQRRWIYCQNIRFAERHTDDHDHSVLHFLTYFIKTLNNYYYYSSDTWFESRLGAEFLDLCFRGFLISFQKFLALVKRTSLLTFSSTPHL